VVGGHHNQCLFNPLWRLYTKAPLLDSSKQHQAGISKHNNNQRLSVVLVCSTPTQHSFRITFRDMDIAIATMVILGGCPPPMLKYITAIIM
jgi:hypothetical protein